MLFRECDWTGRRLLFDSSAIQKVDVTPTSKLIVSESSVAKQNTLNNIKNNNNSDKSTNEKSASGHFIEVSNGYGYIYDATLIDNNSIGEMIFGSIAMSFRGTSLKVKIFDLHSVRVGIEFKFFVFHFAGSLVIRTETHNVFASVLITNIFRS